MRDLWAECKAFSNKGSIVELGVAFVLGVVFVGSQAFRDELRPSNDYVGERV